jgi:hypothetical protein
MYNPINYIISKRQSLNIVAYVLRKKYVDDVQEYCVNSSTFLLDAMGNYLKL